MRNAFRFPLAVALGVTGALSVLAGVEVAHADRDSRPGVVAERPRDAGVHAVDGEVRTVAQVGGSVVIGGSFTRVGPVTRGAVGIVDTATKTFALGFPDVVGQVSVAVPDGSGGWYVGGSFSSVGGVARANLAQVDSSGQVTAFDPSPNGAVLDLATTTNGDLIAAGGFSTVAGQTARGVARLAAGGGLVWGGSVTGGSIRALALTGDGTLVYVGGDFSQVGGVVFRRLAALDAATGSRNTTFAVGTPNQPVNDIVVRSSGADRGDDRVLEVLEVRSGVSARGPAGVDVGVRAVLGVRAEPPHVQRDQGVPGGVVDGLYPGGRARRDGGGVADQWSFVADPVRAGDGR